MSNKLPAFQFYPGDWRKDIAVQSLGFFERGVWFEMLCMMHESEDRGALRLNGQPMADEAIARVLGLDNQTWNQTRTKILASGCASLDEDGALICRRMVRDENVRRIHAEMGKLGGRKPKQEPKPNQTPNQNITPSSSSSTSIHRDMDRATHAHALYLTQELQVPSTMGTIAPLLQLIDFEAQNRGDPEKAVEFLIAEGMAAKARGETVNIWWLTNKKYEGSTNARLPQSQQDKPSATRQRIDGNRRAIAETLAKRGIRGPWGADGENGQAIPQPGPEGRATGVSGGSGAVGPEVLPPLRC